MRDILGYQPQNIDVFNKILFCFGIFLSNNAFFSIIFSTFAHNKAIPIYLHRLMYQRRHQT